MRNRAAILLCLCSMAWAGLTASDRRSVVALLSTYLQYHTFLRQAKAGILAKSSLRGVPSALLSASLDALLTRVESHMGLSWNCRAAFASTEACCYERSVGAGGVSSRAPSSPGTSGSPDYELVASVRARRRRDEKHEKMSKLKTCRERGKLVTVILHGRHLRRRRRRHLRRRAGRGAARARGGRGARVEGGRAHGRL